MSRTVALSSHWLLYAALASCASDVDAPGACFCGVNIIAPSPMYSAYDGVHAFSVAPYIPGAGPDSLDSDPIMASTIRWQFDKSFVEASDLPELPGGVKLTTKRPGTTSVRMTATTLRGSELHDETELRITDGKSGDWDIGDARYTRGEMVDLSSSFPSSRAPLEGTCGLSLEIDLPTTAACVSCHDNRNSLSAEATSTDTARYSDSQLLNIVMSGAKPAGETFESPFLRSMPMPDCVFAALHTFELSKPEEQGIVLKLRSIPPRATHTITTQ